MGLAQIIHEEAHLLYRICQVRTSQDDVLESADKTPIGGWISNRGDLGRGELGLSINKIHCRVTCRHVHSLKNVDGVLSLTHE